MPELLCLRGLFRPVLQLPSSRDSPCLVRWQPRSSSPTRMVWRLPMQNAHVSGLYVVVERLQARNVPVRHCLDDHNSRVVWRAPELQHGMSEEHGHAYRELHRSAHVGPAIVYGGPCNVYVVLRICPSVPAPQYRPCRPAPELALPCRAWDRVDSGERAHRYCGRAVHVGVPCSAKHLALPVRQV